MLEELRQMWADPHARHAAMVHAPIVLSIVAIVPLLAAILTRLKPKGPRVGAILCLLGASIGAGLAAGAGEEAEEIVEAQQALSPIEKEAIERHEGLGDGGWKWPLIPAVLMAGTFLPLKGGLMGKARWAAAVLALVGCLGAGVWAGMTAHSGGRLVYVHGLGVPKRPSPMGALPTPAEPRGEGNDESR